MQNKNPFDNNKKIDKSYILKNCNIVDTKNLKIRNGDIFLKINSLKELEIIYQIQLIHKPKLLIVETFMSHLD